MNHRYSSLSLLGDNSININSLEGNKEYVEYYESNDENNTKENKKLNEIRDKIFSKLLVPLLKYDFGTVKNNFHLFEHYNIELLRCDCYTQKDKDDKNNYINLIKFISVAKDSNEKLEKFNLKELGSSLGYSINVSSVNLKSEYIIYDNILGKPEKFNYVKKYVDKIKSLIEKDPEIEYNRLFYLVKQEYYNDL